MNMVTPMADKYLLPDGSIKSFSGVEVEPADAGRAVFYEQRSPKASKWLLPDGSIVSGLPIEGRFGDVPNGNYSYFEEDGTLVSVGTAITYRDEYVGGEYFVPQGSASPDIVNVTIGGVVTRKYAFDGGNTIERLGNTFEIPHDIAIAQVNAGTEKIEIHVHFGPSDANAGDVRWLVTLCVIKAQGAPIALTAGEIIRTVEVDQTYFNLIRGFELEVPVGGFGIGDLIEFTVTREPADAADTYESDALFYKAAMHIPMDTLGSRQRYIK